ncbi:MAG: UbiA family prenyltransferase [Acidobacteriaceae bacterium]
MNAESRAQSTAEISSISAEPCVAADGAPAASGNVERGDGNSRTIAAVSNLPLCVDLDGTLVKSNTLADSLCVLARTRPASLLRLPAWLAAGNARMKYEVAARAPLDAAHLPYNEALILYLREQATSGRRLYLSTGADRQLADRVAAHFGLFDEVFSSDGATNLTGASKLRRLASRFGDDGFAYIGNSRKDLLLLSASKAAMLANPTVGLERLLKRRNVPVLNVFQDRAPTARSMWRALRVHQWAKNVLIFLPLLLAHAIGMAELVQSALAFLSFSLVASSTYVVNDVLDLAADRSHATKRRRPFAAGELSVLAGLCLAIVLFAAGVLISIPLAPKFLVWLLIYCGATLAYSLYFKRVVIVDVIILSGLYTLRILAGAAAARVPVSDWMAGFAIFLFFSLALVKRFSELENLRARGAAPTNGRGYLLHDMEQLRALGTGSAFASIVVFALYINNPEVRQLYHHPQRLWLLTPLLIWWMSRVWLRASRGQMNEDPVIFALTDRASLLAGVAIFLIALAASL